MHRSGGAPLGRPQILIIELNVLHEEVLAPQIELLKEDFAITVAAPREVLDCDLIKAYRGVFDSVVLASHRRPRIAAIELVARVVIHIHRYARLAAAVRRGAYRCLVFNTVSGPAHVRIIRRLFTGLPKVHVIHNGQLYLAPKRRKLLRTFQRNVVISEDVKRKFSEMLGGAGGNELGYFLPIFFDTALSSMSRADLAASYPVGQDMVNIGVVGSIVPQRRNYDGLFRSLAEARDALAGAPFRIHLLSRIPSSYARLIRDVDIGEHLVTYEQRLPFTALFSLVERMDLLAFLVDRNVPNSQHYNRTKISGTSSILKAFRKPALSSTDFKVDSAWKAATFFYPGDRIEEFLTAIARGEITKASIASCAANLRVPAYMSLEEQRRNYAGLIAAVIEDT